MELLDRYIETVRGLLPRAQRDDIALEISDTLRSEIEDKETQLGRPLERDEESAILRAYGHPRLVASRYGSQQHLIGPTLLPFYFYTLRIVLVIAAIVAVIIAGFACSIPTMLRACSSNFGDRCGSRSLRLSASFPLFFALLELWVDSPASIDGSQFAAADSRFKLRAALEFRDRFAPQPCVRWILGVIPVRQLVDFIVPSTGPAYAIASPIALFPWWHVRVAALLLWRASTSPPRAIIAAALTVTNVLTLRRQAAPLHAARNNGS